MEFSLILPTGEVAAFVKPRAPSSSELPCESRGSLAPTPALFSGVGPPIGVVLASSKLCGWKAGGTHIVSDRHLPNIYFWRAKGFAGDP